MLFFRKPLSRLWRRPRESSMELRLEKLGPTFRKQEQPACACCGYDAEFILRVGTLDRMFCERDLVNALLDAVNWNVRTPSSLEA